MLLGRHNLHLTVTFGIEYYEFGEHHIREAVLSVCVLYWESVLIRQPQMVTTQTGALCSFHIHV